MIVTPKVVPAMTLAEELELVPLESEDLDELFEIHAEKYQRQSMPEPSMVKNFQAEPAHGFLEEAGDAMKARATLRDTPNGERTAARVAQVFNVLTNHSITEADAWTFLLILKLVRSRSGKYNRDDYVDLAAYSGLLGECESGDMERQ